ncbi:MAG: tRNA pseudouridine(13) synthase TruD [Pseudohongiellaceae bacterium]
MPGVDVAARAGGIPAVTARFRESPDDFVVEEQLGWEPGGGGEHLFLLVRKRGLTTAEVARRVADRAGVRTRQVSHAGLKDRQGVCIQWLSVQLPGREDPDFSPLEGEDLRILRQVRNSRRLRIGSHAGNRFTIALRELADPDRQWARRLEQIGLEGVPNYFGEQRFGRDNPARLLAWFRGEWQPRGRQERSLLLSTARALLFNCLLSRRVTDGNWNDHIPGDVMMLDGSNSHFASERENEEELEQRLRSGDIHPSGPLWGRGDLPTRGKAREWEQRLQADSPLLCRGLEERGLMMQRRSLRLPVRELQCRHEEKHRVVLTFALPAGTYATSVLRELCHYSEAGPLIGPLA